MSKGNAMIKRGKKLIVNRTRPESIKVMATEEEKEELSRAAEIESMSLSGWLRRVGLKAARKATGEKK